MSTASFVPGFPERLAEAADATEARLRQLLGDDPHPGEIARPPRLTAAMRHAVLAGGKRFRPFLLVECARLFGIGQDQSVQAAAALECLHTYSLVHDDLPCMDDDDLRRGIPTVHKVFGEAAAVLGGDALLTLAFAVLTDPETHQDGAVRAELVHVLATAAGPGGMVGGQMLDLESEHADLDEVAIGRVQAMKTGALMGAACEMGAVLGGAAASDRAALARFGQALGLAFQIADDLLDAEASASSLGKATGKDAARGKATFVAILGTEGAKELLRSTVMTSRRHLDAFGPSAAVLIEAARFASERDR